MAKTPQITSMIKTAHKSGSSRLPSAEYAGGADIFRELQDTGYGSREYGARDLEGFVWSFGTYRP